MNYYDYGYEAVETTDVATSLFGGLMASMGVTMLISGAISIFMLVAMWKLFKKAGKNGWECLIPIYNIIVMLEITELPTWYIILFFVPIANIYAMFKLYIELAHKFGQSTGFGVAMVFFAIICVPILAFGSATYQGKGVALQNNYVPNQDTFANNQMSQQNVYTGQMQQPVTMPVNEQPAIQPQFITEPVVAPQVQQPVQQPTVAPVAPVATQPQVQQPVQQSTVAPVAPVATQPIQPAVAQNVAPTITDIPQIDNQQSKFCPKCGNKISMDADTCFMCGYKF